MHCCRAQPLRQLGFLVNVTYTFSIKVTPSGGRQRSLYSHEACRLHADVVIMLRDIFEYLLETGSITMKCSRRIAGDERIILKTFRPNRISGSGCKNCGLKIPSGYGNNGKTLPGITFWDILYMALLPELIQMNGWMNE